MVLVVGIIDGIPTKRARRQCIATDKEILALRTPGRHSIGEGLIFVVKPGGTRSWIARISDPMKKRYDIGLGPYREVSLKDARRRAGEMRNQARGGIDTLAAKRAAAVGSITFRQAAEQFHKERCSVEFRSQKLADQWIRTVRDYAFKDLGALPIEQITGPMVVRVVKPILKNEKYETARRVLRRVAAVIAWSVGHGYREYELPMASIRNALGKRTGKVVHHAAVEYDHAAEFLAELRGRHSMAALALEFAILTAARSGESRGALWSEIDLQAHTWIIPAERIKAAREHRVPLSGAALAVLYRMLDTRSTDDLVFPSSGRTQPGKLIPNPQALSDVALSKIQKSIAPDTTVHGWRRTFRTWCSDDIAQMPGQIAECALAHENPNRIESSYNNTTYFNHRIDLMATWAAYLASDVNWKTHLKEF